ncbi:hypothetical protein IG631_11096 [Alternaria alternata]|nr:hypothetical protein IG631_11096 [Alternaria alternata]
MDCDATPVLVRDEVRRCVRSPIRSSNEIASRERHPTPQQKQAFAVGIVGINGKAVTRNYVAIATLSPCDTMA